MTFDPQKSFFICDVFQGHSSNAVNNGGRLPMVASLATADDDFIKGYDKNGKPINVYKITEANEKSNKKDVFMAYWCPYEPNRTSYTTLTLLADYMFTATMDGCTFGIGHSARDGSVTVSHANAEELDTPTSHAGMIAGQKAGILSRLGSKAKLFQPKDYRTRGLINKKSDVSAMTFGIRENKKWNFYAHRFRKQSEGFFQVYRIYETVKLK